MNRMLATTALALVLLSAPVAPSAVTAATPAGAITWTVDHAKKTITVVVQLEIYTGCSGDGAGTDKERASACGLPQSMLSGPTQFLADKIKAQMEGVWNKPYRYRGCYTLIVTVDIKRGTDRSSVAPERIAVRIDPSPAGIRDYVSTDTHDPSKWRSDDPADRLSPGNDGAWETTWSESSALDPNVYAHELGHILGLHDGYRDDVDPTTGRIRAVPYPDAPLDLMSFGTGNIAQETIDRLVKRNLPQMKDTSGNPVTDADLACDYEGQWAGARLVGVIRYCGSTETPYWGADIEHVNGSRAFVAYDIPEGSDESAPAEIITPFLDPDMTESLKGTGRFVPADPPDSPHFFLENGEGSYIVTLKVGSFCRQDPP